MNRITKVIIAVDEQSGSSGGWAYWVHTNDGLDSSGSLGGKHFRVRSLKSLLKELRSKCPGLKTMLKKSTVISCFSGASSAKRKFITDVSR